MLRKSPSFLCFLMSISISVSTPYQENSPQTTAPWTIPPAYSPRDNCPSKTIAPETITPWTITPKGKLPPDNSPPRTITPWTIPPRQLPQTTTPCQFPPLTIAPPPDNSLPPGHCPGEFPHLTQNFFCFCFGTRSLSAFSVRPWVHFQGRVQPHMFFCAKDDRHAKQL